MRAPAKPFDVRTPLFEPARSLVALALLVLGAGLLGACAPSDPVQELEDARSRYSVEAVSFSVDQTPAGGDAFAAPPMPAEGEGGEAAAGEGAGEEGGAVEPMEPVEVSQDVILDLLVRWDGRDPLPGLTIDITHADVDGNEKGSHRAYIETADVHRGPPTQMVHHLEDVPYEEGDGFHAEVVSPVPAGERAQYREFSEGGEGE